VCLVEGGGTGPSPWRIAAGVDESEDAEEQANGRKKKDQDRVAKGGTAPGAGRGGILVAHGAALGGGVGGRREGAKNCQNRARKGLFDGKKLQKLTPTSNDSGA